MANSLIVVGQTSASIADASTSFVGIVGRSKPNATESIVELPIRDAGVFSNLFVRLTANDVASATSCTVTLRLSRANTAVTVSFGTSQTGVVEDQTHTATCVNTDEIDLQVAVTSVSGNHSVTVGEAAVQFAPTTSSNTVSLLACYNDNSIGTASQSHFFPPGGFVGGGTNNTNEAVMKYRVRYTFTASNLYCNVTSNARTTDTIIRTRVNGANGGQTLTYTSTQTGVKEDTSGTDSLVAGDDFCFSIVTGTGTGTFQVANYVCCRSVSTSSVFPFVSAASEGIAQAFNVTTYYPISSGLGTTTTEANTQVYPRFAFTASELGVMVITNTVATSATTVRLRNNTANGNQVISFAAAQTGLLNDSSNMDSIASGTTGTIDFQVATPNTSGSITFIWIGVLGSTSTDDSVSVNDSVTVTESVTNAVQTNISVSDSTAATTESTNIVTVDILSVNDSATGAEAVTLAVAAPVSVNDSSTVSESVTLVTSPILLSVSDSATVTEAITEALVTQISVFDSATGTESVSIVSISLPSVNDSATGSENVSLVVSTPLSVSDSSTVAESIANAVQVQLSVFDSSSIAENVSLVPGVVDLAVSVFDASTVTESVVLAVPASVSVSDASTVTESVVETEITSLSVNDSATASEAVQMVIVSPDTIVVGDDVSVTDVPSLRITLQISVDEDLVNVSESDVLVIVNVPTGVATAEDLYVGTAFSLWTGNPHIGGG